MEMRFYIPRTRTARLQLAFLLLALASLAMFFRVILEDPASVIRSYPRWSASPQELLMLIVPSLRLIFAAAILCALLHLIRSRALKRPAISWAIACVLLCTVEAVASPGSISAILAEWMFWRNNQHIPNAWLGYYGSVASELSFVFLSTPGAIVEWGFQTVFALCIAVLLIRAPLCLPEQVGAEVRLIRTIIYTLVLVNVLYLAYILDDYLFPSRRIYGQYTISYSPPTIDRLLSTARDVLSLPALVGLVVLFARLAFKPGALHDPTRCDHCDYPLEPSFTTCPECGSPRTAPAGSLTPLHNSTE